MLLFNARSPARPKLDHASASSQTASTKMDQLPVRPAFSSALLRNQPAIKVEDNDGLQWPFIPFPEDWYASC